MHGRPEQKHIRLAVGILSIFVLLCVRTNFHYSATSDERKFLRVGEQLASGQGWQTEMSVVHAPLSFYTHGLLLKPFNFSGGNERLHWARVTMLVYSLAMGALVFVWAAKLFNQWGGIVALAMYCFNSNILAHSSLITTDIIYACFSLFLLYFFWLYMSEGGKRWIVASGASLGLALFSKYSAVLWLLLLPVMGMALLVSQFVKRQRESGAGFPRHKPARFLAGMVAMFLLAILVLNIGYGFSGSFTAIGANHYQSRLLAGLSDSPLTSWIPMPIPYPFMRGYDVQKYISEVGHPSFMAGMHSTTGWWYYYLACFLLKMPIAFWPIMIWAGIVILREKDGSRRIAEFILIFSSLAIMGANSFLSKSHAGFRYVLTSVPPLFVLAGAVAVNASASWRKAVLAALMCLYVAPMLWVHPHHVSYFSELVGGPKNGHKWLSDSNLEWGQDAEHARQYVRESDVPITVEPGMMPVPGRILISATTLQDCFATYDIHGWLRPFKPVDYVGYSWLVFDISEESVAARARGTEALPDEYYSGAFEYARDRLHSAEQFAESALALNARLPEALYLLGLCRLGLGKLAESADAFEAVPVSHPFYVEARANLSLIAAVRGNAEASNAFWKQSVMEETLRAYAERPILDVGKYSELSDADPHDWKLRNNLGVSYWAQGMFPEAEEEIRLAIALQPNFIEAFSNLAIVLEDRRRFDESLEALLKYKSDSLLLRARPYRDYRVYYGERRVMLGDTLEVYPKADENVVRLKSHLARNPTDYSTLSQLAVVLMRRGRFGEAHRNLSRALAIGSETSALYTNLGVLYTEKKMFSHALRACKRAIETDPQNLSASELLSSISNRLANAGEEGTVRGYLE